MIRNRNMIDLVIGRLKILEKASSINGRTAWTCICNCGKIKNVRQEYLLSKRTVSCGCLRSETTANKNRTHGMSHTSTYNIWASMIDRCSSPNNKNYNHYGGRGIKVCRDWLKFYNFIRDMGEKPDGLTIERINNDKGYSKENCKWTDRISQMNNTRRNHMINFNGEILSIAQWARKLSISKNVISQRLLRGWSEEKALTV